ncbi:MAG: MarR family transcriptional regulator [Rhodospirillales bacterium]|nr:MarR family transcriptional regulator [Rhodospirillales bacterium]
MPKTHARAAHGAWNFCTVTRKPPQPAVRLGILPSLLGYHLRRAHVAVFQDFARAMAGLDVTPGQVGVLQVIAGNPGLSQTALGRALGIDRSTVVAVIDRLEGRGLVVRALSPNDRRSHALRLSAAGEKTLAEIERRVRAHERRIARGLSAEERERLIGLLAKIEG